MKKIVENQIKMQTRAQLGQADIKDVRSILFKRNLLGIGLDPILWTKKYYAFDRGSNFAINSDDFKNYAQISKVVLPPNSNGAIIDGNLPKFSNSQYSVTVFVSEDTTINLPFTVASNSNVYVKAFYFDIDGDTKKIVPTDIISPSSSFFSGSSISLNLVGGKWTTIEIIVYRKDEGGFIVGLDDLLKYIDNWRLSDFDAPNPPIWHKTPVVTSSNPVSGITQNTLKWIIPDEPDWAGHQIYRKIPIFKQTTVKDNPIVPNNSILSENGTIVSGNVSFVVSTVDPDGFSSGAKISVRNKTYTIAGKSVVLGNFLDNGDFSVYTGSRFRGWRMVSSASGTIGPWTTTAVSFTEHMSGGQCILASCKSTSTVKSIYLESSVFTPVDKLKDYSLSFYTKPNTGLNTYGRFGVAFYQNGTGTLCATPGYTLNYVTSSAWCFNKLDINSNTSSFRGINSSLAYWPSNCTHAKVRLYLTNNLTFGASRYFDNVKLSFFEHNPVYLNNTANSTLVFTKEKLTIPSNRNFLYYHPLGTDTAVIGGNVSNIGPVKARLHSDFNCLGGGKEYTSTVTNYVVNGSFESLTGWTAINVGLSFATGQAYKPLFNSACGILQAPIKDKAATKVASQTISTGPTTSGSYAYSIYAKSDTCTSLYMGMVVTGVLKATVFSLTKNWQRFALYDSANSFLSSKNIFVGIPANCYGKCYVNGAQLEHRTNKAPIAPLPYNDSFRDGVTPKGASFSILTPPVISTATGTIKMFYTPDFSATNARARSTLFTMVSVNFTSDYMTCYYNPPTKRFVFEVNKAGVTSTVVSTVQSFSRGEKISAHCRWGNNTMDITINGKTGLPKTKGISNVNNYGTCILGYFNTITPSQSYNANGIISDFVIANNKFNAKDMFIDSQAVAASPSISGSVTNPSDKTITGYNYELIFDRRRSNNDVKTLSDGLDKSSPISWSHSPVIPNDNYIYLLKCYDDNGNFSSYSDEQSIVAGDKIPPGLITSTSNTRSYGIITWKWVNPVDKDFVKAKIYKSATTTTANFIDSVDGIPGLANSWTQATATGTKNIYITTMDFNGNENKNPVRMTASPLGIDVILKNTHINVEWVSEPAPGLYFTRNAARLFTVIVTADVQFTFPSGSYGLGIYGADNQRLYGATATVAPMSVVNRGNTWQYVWDSISVGLPLYSDASEGYGAIKFKARYGTNDIDQAISINLDKTSPSAPTITLNGVGGVSPNYVGDKQIISAKFTSPPVDKYQCQVSTVNSPAANGWYTDFDSCPVILPNYSKNFQLYGFIRDRALNVSPASAAVNYDFKGIGIKVEITPNTQPNESGWYGANLVLRPSFTVRAETTSPNTLVRLSHKIKRINPAGADITGSQTFAAAQVLTRSISFGGATADGIYELVCTAVDSLSRSGTSNQVIVRQDDTKPTVNANVWVTSVTGYHNRSAYLKWYPQHISDTLSGVKSVHIYRNQNDAANTFKRIATMAYNVDNYTDQEDILEGYVTYTYYLQAEDYAGNTANSVTKQINIPADWESTYRNWLDNGSFEVENNQHWGVFSGSGTALRTASFKLFGSYSMSLGSAFDYATQKVMLPEMSTLFIKADTRWTFSYYLFPSLVPTIVIYYYDYAGNVLTFDTFVPGAQTAGTALTDAAGNTWNRRYIVLDANAIRLDATKGQSTMVEIRIVSNGGGAINIDGVQWEETRSANPAPTKFRDNRVETIERLHAGFIRANMIKVGDLHAGLFHANGVEITDSITGTPYLQIGDYVTGSSFLRFGKYGGYRHFVGDAVGFGFNLIDHVESGISRNSSVFFRKPYKDWTGANVQPKVLVQPLTMQTYEPTGVGNPQSIDVRVSNDHQTFTANFYLIVGALVTTEEQNLAAFTHDVFQTINLLHTNSKSQFAWRWAVDWTASEAAPQSITMTFEVNNGAWVSAGTRIITSNQTESVEYEYNYSNLSLFTINAVRMKFTRNTGVAPTTLNAIIGQRIIYTYPSGGVYTIINLPNVPYRWTSLHNLY